MSGWLYCKSYSSALMHEVIVPAGCCCVSVVVVWGGGAVIDEVILQLVGNVRLAVLQELQQCTDE